MRKPAILIPLLGALLGACSGGEIVGVHVRLAADGSGKLTTRSLQPGRSASSAETRANGVQWQIRAALVSSQGDFARIAEVTLGDGEVTFAPQLDGDRPGLRVTLRRGPEAKWVRAFAPSKADRTTMARAHDPSGRTKEIADVLRLEIEAPGEVITSGVLPTGRGVEADRDGRRGILLLPVETVMEQGDDFVWDVSWLRAK